MFETAKECSVETLDTATRNSVVMWQGERFFNQALCLGRVIEDIEMTYCI
jgi:hypothetical protein